MPEPNSTTLLGSGVVPLLVVPVMVWVLLSSGHYVTPVNSKVNAICFIDLRSLITWLVSEAVRVGRRGWGRETTSLRQDDSTPLEQFLRSYIRK